LEEKMRRFVLSILFLTFWAAASWAASTSTPVFGSSAVATEPADTLKVDYFSNANTSGAPDGTLRLDNPGTPGTNVCAYIGVFDSNQEMSECCGCLLTPDGLRTLSIDSNLTNNPFNGVTLATGVIKILSVTTVNNTCPFPGTSKTEQFYTSGGVRSWGTHIQNSNFTITETASQDATLSVTENVRFYDGCVAIGLVGSGTGVCSCGTGE
jgi:hypothetical protein